MPKTGVPKTKVSYTVQANYVTIVKDDITDALAVMKALTKLGVVNMTFQVNTRHVRDQDG